MQSIELERFANNVERVLREKPSLRRELYSKLSKIAKTTVDGQISAMINDSRGRVRSWQEEKVGSGGGYARVKAVGGKSGKDSPGAITNYLVSGHKVRPSKAVWKKGKYRSRAKMTFVAGRPFYESAAAIMGPQADAEAEAFVERLASMLGE